MSLNFIPDELSTIEATPFLFPGAPASSLVDSFGFQDGRARYASNHSGFLPLQHGGDGLLLHVIGDLDLLLVTLGSLSQNSSGECGMVIILAMTSSPKSL